MKSKRIILAVLLAIAACRPLYSMNESPCNDTLANLKNLLYWNMVTDSSRKQCGEYTFAVKSGTKAPKLNKAFAYPTTTENEVEAVLDYMGDTPFSWYVADNQPEVKELLKQKGFVFEGTEYMMQGIKTEEKENGLQGSDESNFTVTYVDNYPAFMAWKEIVARNFDLSEQEIDNFWNNFYHQAQSWDSLVGNFLGSCNGKPVSTGAVFFDEKASLKGTIHFVSTLEQYRKQGCATAVVEKMLRSTDLFPFIVTFILFASPMAHEWLQKTKFYYGLLQFEDIGTYDVYTKNVSDEPVNSSTNTGNSGQGKCYIF